MDPANAEEWIEIARQRAADATAMLPAREQSVGPVYMAGYAVECALKAFLDRNNIWAEPVSFSVGSRSRSAGPGGPSHELSARHP